MRITHWIVVAGVALAAGAAAQGIAQTVAQPGTQPSGQMRVMPNLSEANFSICMQTLNKIDEPQQIACAVTGEISKYGRVEKTSGKCDNADYNKPAAKCLSGYKVTDAYKGVTGPVCVAMLFDIRAAPEQKGHDPVKRSFGVREYPCPAAPTPG